MRIIYLTASACWFLFTAALLLFLVQYLAAGAGLHFFGAWISTGSILLGWIHVVGFLFAALISFSVGVGFYLRGVAGPNR